LSARALSVTAMVGDGLMRLMVSARKAIRNLRLSAARWYRAGLAIASRKACLFNEI
jgi:hypothetical protein